VLLLLLFLLIPLITWTGLREASSLPRYALLATTGGFGLVLWTANAWRFGDGVRGHPILVPVGLLWAWSAVSYFWSVDPGGSQIRLFELSGVLVTAFIVYQRSSADAATRLFAVASAAGAIVALIGIGQYFGINPLGLRQAVAPASTFINKNFVALYLDLVTPVAAMLALTLATPKRRWLAALAFGLCLSFLIVSRTRGSWLGLLVGLAALIMVQWGDGALKQDMRQWLRARWKPVVAALILPAVLISLPGDIFKSGYKTEALITGRADLSVSTRLSAYLNAGQMIADHPLLGVGYGGFMLGYKPYAFSRAPTNILTEDKLMARLHSDPLQQFVELGLPGGLLSLGIYAWALLLAWRLARTGRDSRHRSIGLALLLALVASGAHACVDFPLHKPASQLLFWCWIALAAGLTLHSGDDPSRARQALRRPILLAVAVIGLGFSALAAAFYRPYLIADGLTHNAVVHMFAEKDCPAARTAIDRAWATFHKGFYTREYYLRIYARCHFKAAPTLTAMNRVLEYDPNNALALLTRGRIYLYLHRSESATEDFYRAVQLLPNRASGYLGLGLAARQSGNTKVAKAFFEEAAKVEPDNPLPEKYLADMDRRSSIDNK